MMGLSFTWDAAKARTNLRKHRVSFEEAVTVFGDPLALQILDPVHSENEERFILLGNSDRNRVLLVVYSIPEDDVIRIISARKATHSEREQYHQAAVRKLAGQ